MSVLAMQPPVQLLSSPRPFVRTLNLPSDTLVEHLLLLRSTVSSLRVAQQAAQAYTGTLLSPNAGQLLLNAKKVSGLLNLSQASATQQHVSLCCPVMYAQHSRYPQCLAFVLNARTYPKTPTRTL